MDRLTVVVIVVGFLLIKFISLPSGHQVSALHQMLKEVRDLLVIIEKRSRK